MNKKGPNCKTIIACKISAYLCNTEQPYLNIFKNKTAKLEAIPAYISM